MNKTILIIIIILIVVVGGYFLFRGSPQATAPTPTAPTPAPGVAPEDVEETIVLPEEEAGQLPEQSEPAPEPEEETAAPEVREFTVSGTEYSFSPSSIIVNTGDQVKVTFKNGGSIIHNLQISGLGVGTRTINPGQTDVVEFTAPASGIYTFFCSISTHRAAGMEGQLKVE